MILPKPLRFLCLLSVITIVWWIFYDAGVRLSPIELFGEVSDNLAQNTTVETVNQEHLLSVDIQADTQQKEVVPDPRLQELLASEDSIKTEEIQSSNNQFLSQIFAQTKDVKLIDIIVQDFLSSYQFVNAKNFIQSLSPEQKIFLDPKLDLQVAFNSFQLSSAKSAVGTLKQLLSTYSSTQSITVEETNRYLWILALMQKNYNEFFIISQSFSDSAHKAFLQKISELQSQVYQPWDLPSYYFDALVAIELFNQWFYYPAKILALDVLSQDSEYILPYQILAYSNFFTNSRDASISYFSTLKKLDPSSMEKYTFLVWVAYFRNQQYENAILQLNQIKKADFYQDSLRYLALSYLNLSQPKKAVQTMWDILQTNPLLSSDFYNYFYESFFKPYSVWWEFSLYQTNPALAKQYLAVCEQYNEPSFEAVCEYGKVGLSLVESVNINFEKTLLELAESYPQWYLFQILGEYYQKKWNSQDAKYYLLKAVSLSSDEKEIYKIKTLLQKVM